MPKRGPLSELFSTVSAAHNLQPTFCSTTCALLVSPPILSLPRKQNLSICSFTGYEIEFVRNNSVSLGVKERTTWLTSSRRPSQCIFIAPFCPFSSAFCQHLAQSFKAHELVAHVRKCFVTMREIMTANCYLSNITSNFVKSLHLVDYAQSSLVLLILHSLAHYSLRGCVHVCTYNHPILTSICTSICLCAFILASFIS